MSISRLAFCCSSATVMTILSHQMMLLGSVRNQSLGYISYREISF